MSLFLLFFIVYLITLFLGGFNDLIERANKINRNRKGNKHD